MFSLIMKFYNSSINLINMAYISRQLYKEVIHCKLGYMNHAFTSLNPLYTLQWTYTIKILQIRDKIPRVYFYFLIKFLICNMSTSFSIVHHYMIIYSLVILFVYLQRLTVTKFGAAYLPLHKILHRNKWLLHKITFLKIRSFTKFHCLSALYRNSNA